MTQLTNARSAFPKLSASNDVAQPAESTLKAIAEQ